MAAHYIPTDSENAAPNSHQDQLSNQNIQVFSWALDAPIISLNNALFLVWLPDYCIGIITLNLSSAGKFFPFYITDFASVPRYT